MTRTILFSLILLSCTHLNRERKKAPPKLAENLIIVTIDGLRWQEIFGGLDEVLLADKNYTRVPDKLRERFHSIHKERERKKLFPFFWKTIAKSGQLYGDHSRGSIVEVANPYHLSYPGYNEIFTGFPDPKIVKNDEFKNPNENVLAFINRQRGFEKKVAVFATWPHFHYILDSKKNGLLVNTSGDAFSFSGENFRLLNELQKLSPRPVGYRPDVFTYMAAKEYLKAQRPRVLYIAFDETDDMAHMGHYDQYIESAHATDGMLADLWETLQSIPEYKGKTTLVITTDHGRGGAGKGSWINHGNFPKYPVYHIPESNQTWIALLGAGVAPRGVVTGERKIYQAQLAKTFARILGLEFSPDHQAYDPMEGIDQ